MSTVAGTQASDVIRRLTGVEWSHAELMTREWLVTNGLGGYASGTVAGPPSRRYHALLVSALPAPLGRMVLVTQVDEEFRFADGRVVDMNSPAGTDPIRFTEFRLVGGLPTWQYECDDLAFERRLFMPHEQNSVFLTYLVHRSPERVRLRARPRLVARAHAAAVDALLPEHPVVAAHEDCLEATLGERIPAVRLAIREHVATFTMGGEAIHDLPYELEQQRGYPGRGSVWSPGYFSLDLGEGERATFVASTEPLVNVDALEPNAAWEVELERRSRLLESAGSPPAGTLTAELVLAADQFLIKPAARTADTARAQAAGEHARSVIAGYHWFTDWGRDTMISLEGLTLCTGRTAEARDTLLTFMQHLRDGLIPNLFPEGDQLGLYNTADATLWLFHALDRYVSRTGDVEMLRHLLPALDGVVSAHQAGTRFGIRVAGDGLLTQGESAVALTWMDAKVDDWVVTPRRGKAVELNALWYNAVSLLAQWHHDFDGSTSASSSIAELTKRTFNQRFWFAGGGYLYDIVDGERGDDRSCRPNQLLAFSLRYPVLDKGRWRPVLDVVSERLLTPFGLRTLEPADPGFKSQYFGDLRARDAAYHQGTVWPWLLGPFIDAWLRVNPERRTDARALLAAFDRHLSDACVGSVSEIFDATEPFAPRGCIAQAWSVAEVLRCLVGLGEPFADESPAGGESTSA